MLNERVQRTNAVLEQYRNKPFDWKTRGNCIHLARAQASALGMQVPSVPPFRSYRGALRALKATGFDTLEALMDSQFLRIAPSRLIVGDIGMLPGAAPFGALVIAAGGGMVLGWHDADPSRMRPIAINGAAFVAAWKIGR